MFISIRPMGGEGGFFMRRKDLIKKYKGPKGLSMYISGKLFCKITGIEIYDGFVAVPCKCVFDISIVHLLSDLCPSCNLPISELVDVDQIKRLD